MKLNILDKTGKKVGDFDFKVKSDVRDDIFKKAVLAEFSLFRQEKGADPLAGKRSSINVSKRRKAFRSTYGKGGSRTPKKTMWARGQQHRFVGAFAPNTVGGRKAHAPKSQKIIIKNLNNKEWNRAIISGLSASLNRDLVMQNGQKVPENYPFIIDSKTEELSKTKEFLETLEKLGFGDEIERTSERKIRAGRGTMRNRTYKTKRGPLVIVSSMEVALQKATRNIQGFDVVSADLLLASDFGMSEKPGRAVVFTQAGAQEFIDGIEGGKN
jgi:large subunit ribosomal protein L4e